MTVTRMIASDIDGTLLRSDGTMSPRTAAAIATAEEAGLLVVLCTGRPPRWMRAIAEATGHHGLAVCANGALIYDLHTETVVEEFPIEVGVAREITTLLREKLPDVAFAVERAGGMWHESRYVPLAPHTVTEAELEQLLTEPMAKLIAKHPDMSAAELHDVARGVIGDVAKVALTYSSATILEMSAAGITKAFALETLATERGIEAAESIAFGDMPNDIPLLEWAGRGVAVANAHPDVIAIADEVCASNDDDGPASVIEDLLGASST